MGLLKVTDIDFGFSSWSIKDKGLTLELRKRFGSDVLIIVNNGEGYDYKSFTKEPDRWGRSTKGINIHFSCNGPLQMSFEQWDELNIIIKRCERYFAD